MLTLDSNDVTDYCNFWPSKCCEKHVSSKHPIFFTNMNDQSVCCVLVKCVRLGTELWRIGKIFGNLIFTRFCTVWEDDISDSDICLNFYTIRKLRDFSNKM